MASRAVPVPGPTVEQGVRAAKADPGTRVTMADLGIPWTMVDLGTRAAMAEQGTRAAMANLDIPWALADQGTPWVMAGSPPNSFSWGDCCQGGALEARMLGGTREALN